MKNLNISDYRCSKCGMECMPDNCEFCRLRVVEDPENHWFEKLLLSIFGILMIGGFIWGLFQLAIWLF